MPLDHAFPMHFFIVDVIRGLIWASLKNATIYGSKSEIKRARNIFMVVDKGYFPTSDPETDHKCILGLLTSSGRGI